MLGANSSNRGAQMNNLRKGFRPEKAQMIMLAGGRRLPLLQARGLAVNAHNAASFKEAEDLYRAILRALPADVWTLNYLGVVLHAQGLHEQAKEMLAKAVRVSPQNVEAWINLSNVELALGDLDACETALKAALAKSPDAAQLVINLADVLTSKGQPEEARELLTAAAFRRPDDAALLTTWGSKFLGSFILVHDDRIDTLLCKVLDLPTTWASAYARPVYRYLNRHPILMEMMARIGVGADAQTIIYEAHAHILGLIQSLVKMMGLSSAVDADHEIFLTELRRLQLYQMSLVPAEGSVPLAFSIALAQFCFNNDYVFFESAEEKAQLALLQESIEASVASGVVDWRQVVCFCSYRPLTQLGVAAQIAQAPHGGSLEDLLAQQFGEPTAEIEIRASVGALRPIEDDVSRTVQGMYESSPYPRWTKPCIINPVASLAQALANDGVSGLPQDRAIDEQTRVLVAGCGSGQHSMLSCGKYRPANVTAVDLSLSSLAYAVRKTRECGLTNITYLHGDLLDVGSLGHQFDLVESVGVLHHMKEPMLGWNALVNVLSPGGIMKIGLYSQRARETIFDLRRHYAQEGVIPGPDEVRSIRRDIIARANAGDPKLQQFLSIRDFFSLNEAIDLLFHVQESSYTLVQIAAMIEELGLTFMGLCLPQDNFRPLFLAEQGADADVTSLLQWDEFEQRHPNAFIGMFVFWVMKPAQA